MNLRTIRIGTRSSQLAQWQAKLVAKKLKEIGISSELVLINSEGDDNTHQPIYEMGISGVFTRSLDTALLNDKIDIAVHSMKDVPTQLPQGISQIAVLERGERVDILVAKGCTESMHMHPCVIATSSLRRKAQWLSKFPAHKIVDIRGNVNTRLEKLQQNHWQGVIFAKVGLERISALPENYLVLDWMIPAPAQGAIMLVGNESNLSWLAPLKNLNHTSSEKCTAIERSILSLLEGGCSAPIAASVNLQNSVFTVNAGIYCLDGKKNAEVHISFEEEDYSHIAENTVKELLKIGGDKILSQLKKH